MNAGAITLLYISDVISNRNIWIVTSAVIWTFVLHHNKQDLQWTAKLILNNEEHSFKYMQNHAL